MNDLIAVQSSPPVQQQQNTEKSGKRTESGIDFSTILGKAADRKSEAAFSERSDSSHSRPDRSAKAERAAKPDRSEPADKPDDKKPDEDLAVGAVSAPPANNTDVVEEETPVQEPVVAVDDVPDEPAELPVAAEPAPEVTTEDVEVFSDGLHKIMDELKNNDIKAEVAQNVIKQLSEELNVTQVNPVQVAEDIEEAPVVVNNIDEDTETAGETTVTALTEELPAEETVVVPKQEDAAKYIDKKVTAEYVIDGKAIPVTGTIINDEEGKVFLLLENGEKIAFEDLLKIALVEEPAVIEEEPAVMNPNTFANIISAPTFQGFVPGSAQHYISELLPNMQPMFNQIALLANSTPPGSSSQLVIQLYPEHLGKLRIALSADLDGQISARIESGNPTVRFLFHSGLSDLIDCLRAGGVDLKSLEIAALDTSLSEQDLGQRHLGQNNPNGQNNRSKPFSESRRRTVERIPLVSPSGFSYDTAVMNSYVDENTSVEFTA